MKKFEYLPIRLILSILISAVISLLFIKPGFRYKIEVFQKSPFYIDSRSYYFDLDNDGKSDKILKYYPSLNRTSLIVYNSNADIINQFNIPGKFPEKSEIFSLDYDSDGFNEVYVFTYSADSLFLNFFEPCDSTNQLVISKFIDVAPLEDGEAKYSITSGIAEDINNDGFKEIYFAISAAFALTPRNLYYYDVRNDFVKKSPEAGSGPKYSLSSADINGDGYPEFWGNVPGSGNYKTPIPYSDQEAWLMVFSHNLNFLFEPVGFYEHPAGITPLFLQTKSGKYLAVTYQYGGTNDSLFNKLMIFTPQGKLLRKINLEKEGIKKIGNCFISGSLIVIHDNSDGIMIKFDENLNVVQRIHKEDLAGLASGPFILNDDGTKFLLINRNNSVHFFNEEGKRVAGMILENTGIVISPPELINKYNGFNGFHLNTSSDSWLLTIKSNNYRLIFAVKLMLLFIIVYLTVFLIQYLQIIQLRKKQKIETTLREYQLIAVKNQISPHFIFNALNSISAMYYKGETLAANDFLVDFSRMIRDVVETSDSTIVSLETEIKLIEKYLAIEKIRLGKDFKYTFDIHEDCHEVMIPSMSLHIFVENSVKHGLALKKGDKLLTVSASKDKNCTKIIIADNGPGLKSKSDTIISTGKGLALVSQMFSTFKLITGRDISYIFENIEPSGVKVIITISSK